jgi:hypothetical protein
MITQTSEFFYIKQYIHITNIFTFAHTLLTANTTIQNKCLSAHIHGCFPVELVIYMTLSEGRYPSKWGQHLLQCYDGRFLDDSLFGLSLYNVIQYHTNNREGNFFFNSDRFIGKDPPTVEQLKRQLENKNTKYTSMLRYFARTIRGSDNFWRSKTKDLKHWITHYIARGDGPPTFFITLSCAENWWPDLKCLLGQ